MPTDSTLTEKDQERFWSKVERIGADDCWLWTGTKYHSGYGQFGYGGRKNLKTRRAHRIAWQLLRGPIPEGMCLLHDCPGGDNPACVNPAHMKIGTQLENIADSVAKGRNAKGETSGMRRHPERYPRGLAHWNGKLTDEQVREIRLLHKQGQSYPQIARCFGVTRENIGAVIRGKTHRYVVD